MNINSPFVQFNIVPEAMCSLTNTQSLRIGTGGTVAEIWESFVLPPGYEKPSKEEFEAKLQELIDAQPLKELRQERNKRLAECDWVTLKAYSTDTPVPEEWKVYMQTLRDLPANTEDPANPVWPTRPDEVVNTETVTETSN